MEVLGTIILHICIGDLCTRISFGIVDNLAVNVVLCTAFMDELIKEICPMEQKAKPILALVTNNAECTATGEAKKHPKAEADMNAYYTVSVIRAKTETHNQYRL